MYSIIGLCVCLTAGAAMPQNHLNDSIISKSTNDPVELLFDDETETVPSAQVAEPVVSVEPTQPVRREEINNGAANEYEAEEIPLNRQNVSAEEVGIGALILFGTMAAVFLWFQIFAE
jgi:hypothetical protein